MEEVALGLMKINASTEDILTSAEMLKEIVADLENMEVPVTDILAKLEQGTGRSAKEFECDIRVRVAQTLNEIIALMPFMAQGNESEEKK